MCSTSRWVTSVALSFSAADVKRGFLNNSTVLTSVGNRPITLEKVQCCLTLGPDRNFSSRTYKKTDYASTRWVLLMAWADQACLSDISPPTLGFAEPGTHVHPWAELPQVHLLYHVHPTPTSHNPSADNWSSSSFSPARSSQFILRVATFLALHHGRGAPNSAEPSSFMVVPLQTGQPVFKSLCLGMAWARSHACCLQPLLPVTLGWNQKPNSCCPVVWDSHREQCSPKLVPQPVPVHKLLCGLLAH